MLMVLYLTVYEVQKNLSLLDSPDRANHVCLGNSVQSKAFGQFCPEPPYYIDSECTKIKMKISPFGIR